MLTAHRHCFNPAILPALDALTTDQHTPHRYAVVDWDNTSIFGDIQDAVLAHQCQTLRFAIPPDAMHAILLEGLPQDAFGADFRGCDGQLVTPDMLASDIATDYAWGRANPAQFVAGHWRMASLRARLRVFYDALDANLGHITSCTWITRLYAGLSVPQVHALTHEAIHAQSRLPITRCCWEVPGEAQGVSGRTRSSWAQRLRTQPPMQELYGELGRAGVALYVISASLEEIVRAFASDPRHGYHIPGAHIFGMKLQEDPAGILSHRMREDVPHTQAHGKSATLTSSIMTRHQGLAPLLVAGDSEGDMDMLTGFEQTWRLVLNRASCGSIGELTRTHEELEARVLLQGRDERTGALRPHASSIMLDGSEQLFYTP